MATPPHPADAHRLWWLWRAILAELSGPRYYAWLLKPQRRNWSGFDGVWPLRRSKRFEGVLTLLMLASPAERVGVLRVAEVNQRRQEFYFRLVMVAYITVPLTLGAIWAQLSPKSLIEVFTTYGAGWAGVFSGFAAAAFYRGFADWRARQCLTMIEIGLAEIEAEGR